jgi:excinuclease ABC subunit C
LCPGLEEHKTSLTDYRANLRKLMQYLRGESDKVVAKIEADMQKAAKRQDFEKAATYRNQYYALRALTKQIVFSDKEFLDISKDRGLQGLTDLLGLPQVPRRIEGYDISHMQGTDNVASMVVFTNGLPDKANYRKFKMRIPGNDDFAHMHEAITRRTSQKNIKDWGLPDLFLIDGGKGQVAAAIRARDEMGINRPMIGLAKREEEIVVHLEKSQVSVSQIELQKHNAYVTESDDFVMILLPKNSDIVKLLQRIRDESHRFAVSYHSVLKGKRQTASLLDEIPGIGPVTRKKLIRTFGSLQGVRKASKADIAKVVGEARATQIIAALPKAA